MKTLGIWIVVIGIALLFYGFIMETTVDSSFGTVHNLGLLNQQTNILIVGGFLFLGGIVLTATGQIGNKEKVPKNPVQKSTSHYSESDLRKIKQRKERKEFWDSIPSNEKRHRFTIAFIVGLPFLTGVLSGEVFVTIIFALLFTTPFLVAFRRVETETAVLPLWYAATFYAVSFWTYIPLFSIAMLGIDSSYHLLFLWPIPFITGNFLFPNINKVGGTKRIRKFVGVFIITVLAVIMLGGLLGYLQGWT